MESLLAAKKEELYRNVKDVTFNQWSTSSYHVGMQKCVKDVLGRCLTLVNHVLPVANQ